MSSKQRQGSAGRQVPHTRLEDDSVIEKTYELSKKLGQGSFGVVKEAKNRATGVTWAIKAVNKEKAGSSAIQLLEREVAILKKVQHEHIIHLEEVLETAKRMYLVLELCDQGELADVLKEKGKFTEAETKTIMRNLASAIQYLHKNDIVHRDLKLENILLSHNPENPEDKLHIKVTDFGLSVCKGGVGHENMMQDFCGTPIYMSPEIIDNKTYSQQCDVWAMGIIMYTLLCGNPPFRAREEEKLYEMIKKGEIDFSEPVWEEISEDAKHVISGMLKVDPAHRTTASEVLAHPWITGEERTCQPANVLEMMKQWKDELKLESEEQGEDDSAINGDQKTASTSETEERVSSGSSVGEYTKRSPNGSGGTKKTALKSKSQSSSGGSSSSPARQTQKTINNNVPAGKSRSPITGSKLTTPSPRTQQTHSARTTATPLTKPKSQPSAQPTKKK
ncbi:serine/threonine-protein kinase 33 [Lingula anatina]|uniref:non-specific serine/threonine protein kinase n=1 Tax=Lingula anatina TaxID=7574 RepID=A0A1S3HC64_LINAN|nr:serine/threonine-protein kinase 33 [Lingula anatina]XP_013383604.1 serine/threonine-protein kinase 33 [Lingula anatina]|eukprot:XP_013383603.1 serine/threonine-protein kinase 33 [Lingula anatina]